jgi:phage gpG-like protein
MSGVEMRYTLDDAEMLAQIDALLARGGNLKPGLEDIGQDMVTVTTHAFELQRSPEGVPWPPSAAAKREGRQTLVDRGLRGGLMGSFSYVVGEAGVVYGTNVLHAAFHQLGYTLRPRVSQGHWYEQLVKEIVSVPARPFVGGSERDVARWEATLRDYLAGTPTGGAA